MCSYRPTERRATILTKFTVAGVGVATVGLAFIAQYMWGPVTQMVGSINGSFGSPVVGVFLLASMVPWANKYGVATGVTTSVAFMLTLTLGGQAFGALPRPLPPAPISGCYLFNDTVQNDTSSSKSIFDQSRLLNLTDKTNYTFPNSTAAGTTQMPPGVSSKYDAKFFLFDISYEWYTVLGTLVCMAVGLLVSFLTRHTVTKSDQPNPELILHFCRRFWITRGYTSMRPETPTEPPEGQEKKHLETKKNVQIKNGRNDLHTDSLRDEKL